MRRLVGAYFGNYDAYDQYELYAEFDRVASQVLEALSADTSRGFELTSIKAAFVVERLNEVFGPCSTGWRYVHSPFEWADGEVITEVAVQFQVAKNGVAAVVWDGQSHGWAFVPDTEGGWSWPILAPPAVGLARAPRP